MVILYSSTVFSEQGTSFKNQDRKSQIIQEIIVNSENKQLTDHINRKLNIYKNKQFSQSIRSKITEDIFSTLKQKKILLPDLSEPTFYLTENKLKISFEIRNPYRYGFVITGNQDLSRNYLISREHYIQFFNNAQLIRKVTFKIKTEYLRKGYANIQLDHTIKTDEKNFIKTVYISIQEGRPVKIKSINISGQFSRPVDYYVQFIRKHSGSLVQRNFYYNEGLQRGFKSLLNGLKNEGYLNTTGYLKSSQQKNHKVIIEATVLEGPLSRVKEIKFTGNKYFSDKQLLDIIQTKVNAGLNIDVIEEDIQTIISGYKEAGFIEMILKNKTNIIQYDEQSAEAVLHFDIEEKTKIKVVNIIIKNNQSTKTHFILKNIYIKTGDFLTIDKIDRSIKNLRNLGIFSSINISTEQVDENPENRNLIVQVEERKPRSLRAVLGLNTQRILTARAFVEFTHKNIYGTGRQFFSHLKLQSNIAHYFQLDSTAPDYIEHQVLASYLEPFILGTSFNSQIQIANSSQIFSHRDVQGGGSTNIADTIAVNLLLQRKINRFINLNWIVVGLEQRKEIKYNNKECMDPDSSLCDQKLPLNIASTGLSFNIDKRNSIISTSDGFLSKIFIEYVWPFNIDRSFSKMSFVKMEVKHFDFRPIYRNWILVNSIQGGIIFGIREKTANDGFPVSRGFILGGINSLRGFDGLIDGERVPDKEELPIEGANTIIAGRSSFYFLLKSECRFPITDNLLWTVFYDGGMVGIEAQKFQKPYRHSAGIGLRYKTPLGPVTGYIAFKISPKKNETFILPHLSFGEF